MGLETIVDVSITKGTKSVTQAGFGVALILGQHTRFAGRVEEYADAAEMLDAGFLTSDAEYKAAVKYFSQEKVPEKVKIGRRLAKVAQVVTVTPAVVNNFSYSITINGNAYTYLSDGSATGAEIQAGLIAAVNAGSDPVTASAGTGDDVVLTADVAGTSFTYAVGTNLTAVLTTANVGVIEDLAAVVDEDDDWYCLILTSNAEDDIMNAASDIEQRRKIFICRSDEASVITGSTTDLGSDLKALNYVRTALLWCEDEEQFPDAAWAGRVLPDDPGSETWMFKTLAGIAADNLTSGQAAAAHGKNVNTYETIGGVSITRNGTMAQGEFIDVTRFIDWVVARIQEAIYSRLVNLEKIPYTDAGVAIIEGEVRKVLEMGERVGGISPDPKYTVTVPKVSAVSVANRGARLLPDVNFDFQVAGAVHKVEVNGTISV